MAVTITRGTPDHVEVERLAGRVEAEDGAPPLSDQTLSQLRDPARTHLLARDGDRLVGYAQRSGTDAEIAADPDALDALLDAVTSDAVTSDAVTSDAVTSDAATADGLPVAIWSHGRRSRLVAALDARGFVRVRELHQLRRPSSMPLPPDPPLPDGISIRTFSPGADDAAWLALNATAFAAHPEQGRWDEADLAARLAEPWFDAAGFLLAERAGDLLGFHWTKVHPDGLGEVYVLGVAPGTQGSGLGSALLVRGLRHLVDVRHCPDVLLYVDGDNPAAMHLYERDGFARFDLDVQWRRSPG